MCCEIFCSLWRSDRYCCMCLRIRKGVKAIHFLDLFELFLNTALVYLYVQTRHNITFVPWALILIGNLLPMTFRILGFLMKICGAMRLWTRAAFYCMRVWSVVFMLLILVIQGATTYFLLTDRVSSALDIPVFGAYLETEQSKAQIYKDNYSRLGYGLCTFCDPTDDCRSEFEVYQ